MKVCVVGAGSIGRRHIRNLAEICKKQNEDISIQVYRETDRLLSEDIREYVQEIHCFDDLDPYYDAVFICNPTFMHYETLLRFLNKSDSFFIEKPVFSSLQENIEPFIQSGKRFYVACPLRHCAVLKEARELLENENVISARAICSSYLPDWRPGVDYRTVYSAKKEEGGGVLIDLIHEWDYLSALFGIPKEVKSFYGTYSNLEIDSEDLAIYIARYEKLLVEVHLDYFGRKAQRYLEVFTNEHVYRFDILNKCLFVDGEIKEQYDVDGNDMYLNEMMAFLSIVRGENRSENDIRHAITVMKIAEDRIED